MPDPYSTVTSRPLLIPLLNEAARPDGKPVSAICVANRQRWTLFALSLSDEKFEAVFTVFRNGKNCYPVA